MNLSPPKNNSQKSALNRTNLYKILATITYAEHSNKPHTTTCIAITGGGGKTTLMIKFAHYLRSIGHRILITTTTKIASPNLIDYGADHIFSDDHILAHRPAAATTTLYAIQDTLTTKWHSPPLTTLQAILPNYDIIIAESDGSRHLPIKIHTERDPVIPSFCTYTISILGLWAIGQKPTDVVFGPADTDCPPTTIIDKDYLQWYIDSPEGLLKGSIPSSRAIILNGAENLYQESSPLSESQIKKQISLLKKLKYPKDAFVCTASEQLGELYETIQ